jgi:hypothetical protein
LKVSEIGATGAGAGEATTASVASEDTVFKSSDASAWGGAASWGSAASTELIGTLVSSAARAASAADSMREDIYAAAVCSCRCGGAKKKKN